MTWQTASINIMYIQLEGLSLSLSLSPVATLGETHLFNFKIR